MTTRRRFWPGILLIPGLGLMGQEVWAFQDVYLGDSRLDQVGTAAGLGLWAAAPYLVVAVQMGIAAGRSRLGWWLSLAAGIGVTGVGGYLAVGAATTTSNDPLAGLTWVLAPLVQLEVAVPMGLAVVAVTLVFGRNQPSPAGRLPSSGR